MFFAPLAGLAVLAKALTHEHSISVTVHGVGTTTYRGIRRTDRSILYCRLHRRGERGNQPACKSLVGNGLASVNGYQSVMAKNPKGYFIRLNSCPFINQEPLK